MNTPLPRQRQVEDRKSPTLGTLSAYLLIRSRLSMVIWGVILGLLNTIVVVIFPSFQHSAIALNRLINSLSPTMISLFGLQSDLTTIQGFLASESFTLLIPLALSFYPILFGARAVAGAEESRRLDLLLGNPLPRWQLIVATFIAMVLSLAGALLLIGLLTYLPAVLLAIDLPARDVLAAIFNLMPLCLFTGALALLISSLVRRSLLAIAIPGALIITMDVVNALGQLSDTLRPLQPLTLFHYYGSAIEFGIKWPGFIVISLLAVVLVGLAMVAFNRRDIYT
jgi:ABC-2 type transport system permease protein